MVEKLHGVEIQNSNLGFLCKVNKRLNKYVFLDWIAIGVWLTVLNYRHFFFRQKYRIMPVSLFCLYNCNLSLYSGRFEIGGFQNI